MKTAAPEKKSVKTLKGQLFAAVSMMLVAAIALGTSTYAWFINNQTVEVQKMQLTVSTSTSLLVAVGKKTGLTDGVPTAWTGDKSTIINEDITGVTPTGLAAPGDVADWNTGTSTLTKNLLTNEMIPASISSLGLAAAAKDLTFFVTDNHVSNGKLDQFTSATIGADGSVIGMGAVKRIPLRFTSSSDVDVYFGQDGLTDISTLIFSTLGAKTQAEVTAMPEDTSPQQTAKAAAQKALNEALAIRKALRIAIVPQATTQFTGSVSPVVFQFDGGNASTGNNTDYQYVTSFGDTGATTVAGIPGIQSEAGGIYPALAAADTPTSHITGINKLSALVPAHSTDATNANKRLATVTQNGGTAEVVVPTGNINIFQLKAGEARMVDVYIWLEGTDHDCLNTLSGFSFNLNLPFAAAPTPTP